MNTGESIGIETSKLPPLIGGSVCEYYTAQFSSGMPLPDPARPEDVLDVAHTVMNQTGLHPVQLIGHVAAIKELMGQYKELFS